MITAEEISLMVSYCGRDPRTPVDIEEIVFEECNMDCSLKEFQCALAKSIDKIPEQFRDAARVELELYDCGGGCLRVHFVRPQTTEEVAKDVSRALGYARDSLAKEKRDFERLRKKYGDDP